jgi:hypothetical protein
MRMLRMLSSQLVIQAYCFVGLFFCHLNLFATINPSRVIDHKIILFYMPDVSYNSSFIMNKDTLPRFVVNDSVVEVGYVTLLRNNVQEIKKSLDSNYRNIANDKAKKTVSKLRSTTSIDSNYFKVRSPIEGYFKSSPFLGQVNGMVSYNFNYRSLIDTPFSEKDIAQHILTGRTDIEAKGLPFTITYVVRKSNSNFFQNIADIRASFNPVAFNNKFRGFLIDKKSDLTGKIIDSMTGRKYDLSSLQLTSLGSVLNGGQRRQLLIEAYELINVPELRKARLKTDSLEKINSDSLLMLAHQFIKVDSLQRKYYNQLKLETDSLKKVYDQSLLLYQEIRSLSKAGFSNSSRDLFQKLISRNPQMAELFPSKYRWLFNVRSFSLGRTPLNSSELTAKNITLNGVNFEYQSWYYLAVSAGVVDYRFRDFVIGKNRRNPQPFYMVRLGVGNIQTSNIILTGFSGSKQLYVSSTQLNGLTAVKISGLSLAAKYQLNRNTYVSGEVAQSVSPDLRGNSNKSTTRFSFSGWDNAALSLKAASVIPKSNTSFEGGYKKSGANFQSFSSFQTNAAIESWFLKGEQSFWKRRLKVIASIRTSDFSNPYIIQNYRSDMVFKSITASFKTRKSPVISFGYQPMSQLTVLDSLTLENRFQSLFINASHQYRISGIQSATMVLWSKFINGVRDSTFLYSNATNILFSQQFIFPALNIGFGISQIRNQGYSLLVLDESMHFPFGKMGTVGGGVKINNFNNAQIKVGFSVNTGLRFKNNDMLYINYESGYLPGFKGSLVANKIGSIQFYKSFSFNKKPNRI